MNKARLFGFFILIVILLCCVGVSFASDDFDDCYFEGSSIDSDIDELDLDDSYDYGDDGESDDGSEDESGDDESGDDTDGESDDDESGDDESGDDTDGESDDDESDDESDDDESDDDESDDEDFEDEDDSDDESDDEDFEDEDDSDDESDDEDFEDEDDSDDESDDEDFEDEDDSDDESDDEDFEDEDDSDDESDDEDFEDEDNPDYEYLDDKEYETGDFELHDYIKNGNPIKFVDKAVNYWAYTYSAKGSSDIGSRLNTNNPSNEMDDATSLPESNPADNLEDDCNQDLDNYLTLTKNVVNNNPAVKTIDFGNFNDNSTENDSKNTSGPNFTVIKSNNGSLSIFAIAAIILIGLLALYYRR